MSPSSRSRLRVIETPPDRAVTRLHHLVRQREVLRASFRDTWERLAPGVPEREVEAWAEASLELAFVNAGPACLIALWRASVELKARIGLDTLAAMTHICADVCRYAGAEATLTCLHALAAAARLLDDHPAGLMQWGRGLLRLAREGSESVVALASRTEQILGTLDAAGFECFV